MILLYRSISSNQSAEKLAKGLECPSYVGHHVATFIQSYKDLWSVDFLRISTILVRNLETLVWFPPYPKLIWVLQLSQCPKIHVAEHWGRILKAWLIQSATSRTWGWAPGGGGTPIWNRRECSSEILNLTPKGDHLGVAQAFCDP